MKKWIIIFCLCGTMLAYGVQPPVKNLNIVFIGNSISAGAQLPDPVKDCPPKKACDYLLQQGKFQKVGCYNRAVSGMTSADFLPAFQTQFPKVVTIADSLARDRSALLVFSVMLGTNDSAIQGPNGSPIHPKQYQSNLSVIIEHLLARYPGCRIILHRPIWYSENTYNGAMYLQEGLNRLEKYYPELQALAEDYSTTHPGQIFLGDTEAFDFFRENASSYFNHEKGNAGIFFLHPNKEGAAILGEFWGKAILKSIAHSAKQITSRK